ncbi:MAG: DUF6165 family protein [Reyranellaceae bacterium]
MPDSAPRDLQKAFALHQKGDFAAAERLYQAVLAAAPDQFDALHLLGVLHAQTGRLARAAELLAAAIRIKPAEAAAQFNLGSTLRRLGQPAEAVACFDKAVALDARYGDAHFGRANALVELGRPAEALEAYDRVLALKGARADLFRQRGRLLSELRRRHEALQAYDQAVELDPLDGESFSNRGNLLRDLGRLDEALASHDRAIAARPDRAELLSNRGATLAALRRFEEALADYDRALALQPDFAAAHSNRGVVLRDLGRVEEALASHDRAIALAPDLAVAHSNRGVVLHQLDRLDESLASHDKAVALAPDHAEAHSNRGVALLALQSFDAALTSYDRALALSPDDLEASWNKAQVLLLRGDHDRAWLLHEARRRKPEFPVVGDPAIPLWRDGTALAGKTVLVHWEQGLGDTIQFCRYLRPLRRHAARVLFAPQRPLAGLMRTLGPEIEIVDPGDAALRYDLRIPLISLPLALRSTLQTIPADIPYLGADEARIARWRQRLAGAGFIVGICWQGNRSAIDRGRSFPVAELAPLSRVPGVRLVALQKGDGLAQLADLPEGMRVETPGDDFDAGPDAFLDTAAILRLCDLVVTSDTAVAHLAGALGVRTWVALKAVPDWRWMLDRSDTPWYPTLRLFRQKARGQWAPVFREIAAELARLVEACTGPRTPTIPVSWGELIDKITILEIKRERLKDEQARANVVHEMELLTAVAGPTLSRPDLATLKRTLRALNEVLWDVEDELRRLEAAQRFDDRFVTLARSVYRENDRRAAIKRQINQLLDSEIIEEKGYEPY